MGRYPKPPILAIGNLGLKVGELRGDPIEALVRFGAQMVLVSYLEAEVSASVEKCTTLSVGSVPPDGPGRGECTTPVYRSLGGVLP